MTSCLLTCFGGEGTAPYCVDVVGSNFCWDVVLVLAMPCDGRFVSDPSPCASEPLYILGVGRMFPSVDGLLDY